MTTGNGSRPEIGRLDTTMAAEQCRDVSMGKLLVRGLTRRCPSCGAGKLFDGYYKMKPACPGCGYQFEKRVEEGFFLGALTISIGVAQGFVMLVLLAYIVVRASRDDGVALAPFLIPAGIMTVVLPILCYPFAKTLWAAVDCIMHRMDSGLRGGGLNRPGGR